MSTFLELAELFFPNRCLLCGGRTQGVLCSQCTPKAPAEAQRSPTCYELVASPVADGCCALCKTFPPPARTLRFIWNYEGIYRELIHTIKYKPSKRLATALSKLIAPQVIDLFPEPKWDMVVPVPSSKAALIRRGFNQCVILASACSAISKVPWSIFALTHQGYRSRQAQLAPSRRLQNIRNALCANTNVVKDKRILLIDDVLTTGATISIACQELDRAGAAYIDVFTIARSTNWHSARAEMYEKLYNKRHEDTWRAV